MIKLGANDKVYQYQLLKSRVRQKQRKIYYRESYRNDVDTPCHCDESE